MKKALYLEERERGEAGREASEICGDKSFYRGHCKVMKEQEVLVPKVFPFRRLGSCKVPLYRFL